MNKKELLKFLVPRVLTFIFLTVINFYICIFISIFAAMAGNKFLTTIAIIFFILSTILLFISLFIKKVSFKFKKRSWLILICIFVLCNIGHESYRAYDRSFIRVNEHSLDIYAYIPFEENTKAVLLNEDSNLKITENLPNLDGARALYPVYAAFAQAVYPIDKYYPHNSAVAYNNTIAAYKRLIKRQADMIFVVAPSATQKALAEQEKVKLVLTPIGKEAFVFFVNSKNPVNNLTSQQIKDIYSGKITNWKVLGGYNQSIRAFQRNEDSGSQTTFLQFMGETPIMKAPREDVVVGMGRIIDQTADYKNYSNAIGFSFRFFTQVMVANQDIKLLSIDGVYPSIETIQSNKYPLTTPFFAVTLEDNKAENVKCLLDWVLSSQGQYLIEKTGYIPIQDSFNSN